MILREPTLIAPTHWIFFRAIKGVEKTKVEIPEDIYLAGSDVAIKYVLDNNLLPTPENWEWDGVMWSGRTSFDSGASDYSLLPGDGWVDNKGDAQVVLPSGKLIYVPADTLKRELDGTLSYLPPSNVFSLNRSDLTEK